jgi:hypothetical protein
MIRAEIGLKNGQNINEMFLDFLRSSCNPNAV